MALGATIYKVTLSVSDTDRHFYHDFDLTVARHPSETEERMMVRLIAFAFHADEQLAFTKGISTEDEPDLWQVDYDGTIRLWIDLGQPDEKRVRKGSGRSEKMVIYTYNPKAAGAWWRQHRNKLSRFGNLQTFQLSVRGEPETMVERSMQLQALIQDGELLLDDGTRHVNVNREEWQ